MEAAVFLFEIPTGVVADTYSRRLSLIVGFLGMGVAWMLVGRVSAPWVDHRALGALGSLATRSRAARTRPGSPTRSASRRSGGVFLRGARFGYAGAFVGLFLQFVAIGIVSLRAGGDRRRRGHDRCAALACVFADAGDRLRAGGRAPSARRALRELRTTATPALATPARQPCSCSSSAIEFFDGHVRREAFDRL